MNYMIHDVCKFMAASDQSTYKYNAEQAHLYENLVKEEYEEWLASKSESGFKPVDDLDAVCDLIWVLIGYAHSMGYDLKGAWEEVARSNMDKIDELSGKVLKRADGKVLKPADWEAPYLLPYIGGIF